MYGALKNGKSPGDDDDITADFSRITERPALCVHYQQAEK